MANTDDNNGNGRVTMAVLGVKLDAVTKDMARLFEKMKELQNAFNEHCIHSTMRDNKIESLDFATGTNRENISNLSKEMKDLSDELEILGNKIAPLLITLRVAVFISSIVGASIIGLLWAVFTGQITLVFP
jgi:tetrahydromethanopterin S-methyltransferase subunit B